uniref:Uncharacterized protein n=1 Tax=Glycine max TaxID=3847 RepID=Q32309_SOYBN|nr:unknown [Glycine max]
MSSKKNSSSNSMNFFRILFSLISFKKISDCLVFHQSINQDSRLFLNVKEIHQGKKTIDVRYRRGMNVFFFVIFRLYLMNSTSSHSSTLYDNNLSIKHKFYYKS